MTPARLIGLLILTGLVALLIAVAVGTVGMRGGQPRGPILERTR
jgi:hypothetical protein